jgi:alkanesulfonate monooxygenase SsuD/methylene tetrahydromethanopterin reductase-like flavin-dependent oxidoreductase (luciferase family)
VVIPIHDDNPVRRVPVVTYLLIALNVAVFLFEPISRPAIGDGDVKTAQACKQEAFFRHWAAIPKELVSNEQLDTTVVGVATEVENACLIGPPAYRKVPVLSAVFSMFLHGGWLHLLGNMLFLFVFGNNVEDRLGRLRYLLFYLGWGSSRRTPSRSRTRAPTAPRRRVRRDRGRARRVPRPVPEGARDEPRDVPVLHARAAAGVDRARVVVRPPVGLLVRRRRHGGLGRRVPRARRGLRRGRRRRPRDPAAAARVVTFGVVVVQDVPWPEWRRRVVEVEALGYDAVHVWDHLVHRTLRDDEPLLDSFGALSAAAAITARVRLGTLVASPTLRHPYVLAKQAMTVDAISGGRLDLGIGAAGVARDYEALGIEPWSKAEQVERFRETVELVRAVTGGATSYEGRHYRGTSLAPGMRALPLTIAAHGPRTLRIAAEHAATWNTISPRDLPPDEAVAKAAALSRDLDAACERIGRDPREVRRSVLVGSEHWPVRESAEAFADAVARFRAVGFDDVVLMYPDHPAERSIGHGAADPDIVAKVAEVLPALRG